MTSKEYYTAAAYIPAIILSMVVFGMKYHFEIGIVIEKKTKYIAYINAFSCAVNVGLNWLLIKHLGIVGAFISVNISYLITTLLNLAVTQRLFFVKFHFGRMFQLFGICLVVFSLSLLVRLDSLVMSILLKAILSLFFVGTLLVTSLIPGELVQSVINRTWKRNVG
jgi:Na+-driven multidrug efflux pump